MNTFDENKLAAHKKVKSLFSKLLTVGLSAAFLVGTIEPADARNRYKRYGHRYHKVRHYAGHYNPPHANIVYDVNAGKTLTSVNADALREPASITKVMTLYMLFEQLEKGRMNLDTNLRVSAHAASMPPSKLGLKAGSTIEVEDAIKALVTRSANDVASAIGENIAGSEDAFAALMTRKARAIGMSRTTFRNASGLPKPQNITTARDLVTLGRSIQDRFPNYYKYFATHSFEYKGQVIGNHNRLLGRIEGVDGIKTGYTRASGFNLLTSAKVDGRHVIAVVLGGRSGRIRDAQMASLLNTHMDSATSGGRKNVQVAEADIDTDTDVEVSAAPQVEKAPVVIAPAASRAVAKPKPAVIAEVVKIETRQVAVKSTNVSGASPMRVASAQPIATTTPSGPNLRWNVGAKPLSQADIRVGQPTDPATRKAMGLRAASTEQADPVTTATVAPKPAKIEVPVAVIAKAENAKTEPARTGWVIQVAATDNQNKALAILAAAKSKNKLLASAESFTEQVSKGNATLYRARFGGFESESAENACKSLKKTGYSCFVQRI
jgi:D-alanyl-D-alanine carboxypeptidase